MLQESQGCSTINLVTYCRSRDLNSCVLGELFLLPIFPSPLFMKNVASGNLLGYK